jgi:CelD/BcsL family acetyltransferase involved in cellulose biosynthesis
MSKVLSLKDGIQSGLKTYDFLKGGERYKQRLGGIPLRLFHCRVELD